LKSEARHFEDYLRLLPLSIAENKRVRVSFFLKKDNNLVLSQDSELRFHSGTP